MSNASDLLGSYSMLAGIRLNMVIDRHLRTSGHSGTSRDISNSLDRELLVRLRKLSDIVITDAETAQVENYRPSAWAPIQVWSKTGQFGELVTVAASEEKQSLELVQVSNLEAQVTHTRQAFQSILLESGPTLSRELAKLGEIDELCLTVSEVDDADMAAKVALAFCDSLSLIGFELSKLQIIDGTSYLQLRSTLGVAQV
jgi:riboflavin biosynthesis pyrimidine reductase